MTKMQGRMKIRGNMPVGELMIMIATSLVPILQPPYCMSQKASGGPAFDHAALMRGVSDVPKA